LSIFLFFCICFAFILILFLIFLFYLFFFFFFSLRSVTACLPPFPSCMLDESGGGILQFMDNDVIIG